MNCKGDHTETCGGPNRLDVYQYSSSTLPAPVETTKPSSTKPAATSSLPQPTTTSPGTGKRGSAYSNGNLAGNAEFANFFSPYEKTTWAYDWGYPSHGLDPSFELCVESVPPL